MNENLFVTPEGHEPAFTVVKSGEDYQFSFNERQFQVDDFTLAVKLLYDQNGQEQLNAVQLGALALFRKKLQHQK